MWINIQEASVESMAPNTAARATIGKAWNSPAEYPSSEYKSKVARPF